MSKQPRIANENYNLSKRLEKVTTLWHRASASHHWRVSWPPPPMETKWARTSMGSGMHSHGDSASDDPLRYLVSDHILCPFHLTPDAASQPATQECKVLTIKQRDKCLHLFIFSVIVFILSTLWFFTLSRTSLFFIMFLHLYYKEKIEEVRLSKLKITVVKEFQFQFCNFLLRFFCFYWLSLRGILYI